MNEPSFEQSELRISYQLASQKLANQYIDALGKVPDARPALVVLSEVGALAGDLAFRMISAMNKKGYPAGGDFKDADAVAEFLMSVVMKRMSHTVDILTTDTDIQYHEEDDVVIH